MELMTEKHLQFLCKSDSSQGNRDKYLKTLICLITCERFPKKLISMCICMLVSVILAATIPHLDLMISLVGTLSSSAIALIFPPLLDLVTFSSDLDHFGRCYWRAVKDVLVIIVGLIGFIVGTAVTIMSIVDAFEKDSRNPTNSTCRCDTT